LKFFCCAHAGSIAQRALCVIVIVLRALTSVGVALGAGGSELSVNFYSVDHSPNPIGVEGVDIGLGVNVGWCPGRFKVLDWLMVANQGSTIGQPMAWLDDSPDLSDAVADATSDYVQNNTDPSYIV